MAHLVGLPKGETHIHEHEYLLTADETRNATSPVDAWLGAFGRLQNERLGVAPHREECMAGWQAEAAATSQSRPS